MANPKPAPDLRSLDIGLDRQRFFGSVATTLIGELEETIGMAEASAFVAQVGEELGANIAGLYSEQMGGLPQEADKLAEILIDLKTRIGGDFRIESVSETEIILVNSACPFADRVDGRPSICMMTTNVFGRIVSDARGYAHVKVEDAIATGAKRCRVRIRLVEDQAGDGFEFFG